MFLFIVIQELDACRLDLRRITEEKQSAISNNGVAIYDSFRQAAQIDLAKNQLSTQVQSLQRECNELHTALTEVDGRYRQAIQSEQRLSIDLEKSQLRADFLQKELDQLQKENAESQSRLNSQFRTQLEGRSKEVSEAKHSQDALQNQLQIQESQFTELIKKVSQEKSKYKKLSVKLATRVQQIESQLNIQKQEWREILQKNQVEATVLSNKLNEVERQRDELRLKMTLEASNMNLPGFPYSASNLSDPENFAASLNFGLHPNV